MQWVLTLQFIKILFSILFPAIHKLILYIFNHIKKHMKFNYKAYILILTTKIQRKDSHSCVIYPAQILSCIIE